MASLSICHLDRAARHSVSTGSASRELSPDWQPCTWQPVPKIGWDVRLTQHSEYLALLPPLGAFISIVFVIVAATSVPTRLVTSETSPKHSQSINLHTFQLVGSITPLVLLPSERLPGSSARTYNRTTLAVRFSLQVPGRTREDEVCPAREGW